MRWVIGDVRGVKSKVMEPKRRIGGRGAIVGLRNDLEESDSASRS